MNYQSKGRTHVLDCAQVFQVSFDRTDNIKALEIHLFKKKRIQKIRA